MSVTTSPSPPSDPDSVAPSRRLVMAFIAAVALLFVVLFSVLWYHSWWQIPGTPSAQFIVQGEVEHEGMVVTVEGPELARPIQHAIRKENNYTAFFALPPGSYSLHITRDDRLYLRDPIFHLPEYHRILVSLKKEDEQRSKAASRPG
jgi:hypothetical protein